MVAILKDYLINKVELIGLWLLIVFVLVGNLIWLKQDMRPIPDVDSNLYMYRTLTFIDEIEADGIGKILNSITDLSHVGRPPLYQLMSVPFVLLFGRSMDSGLYVNLVFEIILLIATFGAGRVIGNGKSGLLSAIIVVGYPPLIGLTRYYRPNFALAACVALTVWSLLLLFKDRSVKAAWFFGFSLAFGMWIHPTFLWTVPVPALLICFYIVFSQLHPVQNHKKTYARYLARLREPFVLYGLLPAALVTTGIILVWYLTRGRDILSTLVWINSPDVIEFRGGEIISVGFKGVHPSFWWYAITSPNAISTFFVALLAISMVATLVKRQLPQLILLALFVIGFIILSLQGTLGWRYFAPILPIAALLTGTWIGSLRNKKARVLLSLSCLIVTVLNFIIFSWGLHPWNQTVAFGLGVPKTINTNECASNPGWGYCPNPPTRKVWPVDEIISAVLEDPDCKNGKCEVLDIYQSPYLNYSIFRLYAKQNFREMSLSFPILGNIGGGSPLNLSALFNSEFLLYENVEKPGGKFLSTAIIKLLQSPPPIFASSYREIAKFKTPNGTGAILLKRISPVTVDEAIVTIDAIDLEAKYKTKQYSVLAKLYAEEGDLSKAIEYYELALEKELNTQSKAFYLKEIDRISLLLNKE